MKPKPKKKSAEIRVEDHIKTYDRNGIYKRWFNGLKYFALRIWPPSN